MYALLHVYKRTRATRTRAWYFARVGRVCAKHMGASLCMRKNVCEHSYLAVDLMLVHTARELRK